MNNRDYSQDSSKNQVHVSLRWHAFQHKYAPYLFISPFIVLFLTFSLWPIVKSIALSFHATSGPKDSVFVGLANYQFMLSDPDFYVAVKNTIIFALWSIFLQLPLSLGLALLLNQRWLRLREFFRTIFFSPNLLGSVFVGVIFSVLFVPQYGLLNKFLHTVANIPLDTKWLSDPLLVMPALVITSLWMYVGFNMVYFLAALQAVDQELYDAACVDGANGWQTFKAVTLPGIRPVAIFVLILSTIGSFQLFELPYIMLNNSAGPNKAGLTIVMYLYNNGFVSGDLGYASAVGWTLALGVLLISLLQIKFTGALRSEG